MNKQHLARISARPGFRRRALGAAIALAVGGFAAAPAHAIDFDWGDNWAATLDTTVSYGVSQRMDDPNDNLIGKARFNPTPFTLPNAQQRTAQGRFSVNGDDGNLNYDDGDLFSNAFKITSEFSVNYNDTWGGFCRATYFYDFENADRDDLTELAKYIDWGPFFQTWDLAGPFPAILKDEDRCIRSALCAMRCPTQAIEMERTAFCTTPSSA